MTNPRTQHRRGLYHCSACVCLGLGIAVRFKRAEFVDLNRQLLLTDVEMLSVLLLP
jgi:hypothetical protein